MRIPGDEESEEVAEKEDDEEGGGGKVRRMSRRGEGDLGHFCSRSWSHSSSQMRRGIPSLVFM